MTRTHALRLARQKWGKVARRRQLARFAGRATDTHPTNHGLAKETAEETW